MSERVTIHHGDCLDVLRTLPSASVDSCVTDPPYALVSIAKRFGKPGAAPAKSEGASGVYKRASAGFMGKTWDTGERAFAVEFWAEVLRVLKPGGHCLAFSGTRTYHRLACAIEDAGFEIRDQFAWTYKSGFPKSHDVSKAIDKHLGCKRTRVQVPMGKTSSSALTRGGDKRKASRPWIEKARQQGFHEAASNEAASWKGWGTAAKPAWEPICIARKPLCGTVAANVLQYGTGAFNIDGTRVGTRVGTRTCSTGVIVSQNKAMSGANYGREVVGETIGRWPPNIINDGSDDVLIALGDSLDCACRIFYSAKADDADRCNSLHPTVKPTDLMAYLCRLVTPPGGVVLDPFAGSGSTGMACLREGFHAILIEREDEYVADIRRRIAHVSGADTPLFGGGTELAGGGQKGRLVYGDFAADKSGRRG